MAELSDPSFSTTAAANDLLLDFFDADDDDAALDALIGGIDDGAADGGPVTAPPPPLDPLASDPPHQSGPPVPSGPPPMSEGDDAFPMALQSFQFSGQNLLVDEKKRGTLGDELEQALRDDEPAMDSGDERPITPVPEETPVPEDAEEEAASPPQSTNVIPAGTMTELQRRCIDLEKERDEERTLRIAAEEEAKMKVEILELKCSSTNEEMESLRKQLERTQQELSFAKSAASTAASVVSEGDTETVKELKAQLAQAQKQEKLNEQQIAALVQRVKDDKVKLETAVKAYTDLGANQRKLQEAMDALKKKMNLHKADKQKSAEEYQQYRQTTNRRLSQAQANAARTEKKLRTVKRYLKQGDEDYEALDIYCDKLVEKNKIILRRLSNMYNQLKDDDTRLAKAVLDNISYETLSLRMPNVLGVLQKRDGSGMRNWKNRFIIIKDNLLIYYKAQQGDPHGVMRMDGASIDIIDDRKLGCAFKVTDRCKRERLFRAKDQDDLRQWYDALTVSANFFLPGIRKPEARAHDLGTQNEDKEDGANKNPGPAKRAYVLVEDKDDGSGALITNI